MTFWVHNPNFFAKKCGQKKYLVVMLSSFVQYTAFLGLKWLVNKSNGIGVF